jgi:hypothetical protein
VPTAASKAETWRRLVSDHHLPNWLQRSMLQGFQHSAQTELTAPYAAVSAQGIAGVLARRRTSPYLPGVHSKLWRSILAAPPGERPATDGDLGLGGLAAGAAMGDPDAAAATGTAPVLAMFRRLPFPDEPLEGGPGP